MDNILVVVAHPDDEVLGCGASIAKWAKYGASVNILIMAEGETSRDLSRNVDSKVSELSLLKKSAHKAGEILGVSSVNLLGFPDNRMDSLDRLDVIKEVEKEINRVQPDTVITHHSGDVNIDHRIVHEAVVTACRPKPYQPVKRLLSCEIQSSTEWQTPGSNHIFQPNWYEDVTKTIGLKIEALKAYQTEVREWPHPRSLKNVENIDRWSGSSVGFDAAEAFMLLRELR